jgi:hypothetical protein
MMGEGSIVLKAGERKSITGIACIFSENPIDTTYTVEFSENLKKFVDRIEPQGFTIPPVECTGSGAEKRVCIAKLCNDPNSTSTRMIRVFFSGPPEFSFDFCDGLPCLGFYGKKVYYEGGLKAVGQVGAARTVEVTAFYVHFYPYNGWLTVIATGFILIFVVCIVITKKRKSKRRKHFKRR